MVKVLLENVAQERRENIKTSKDNFPVVGLEHITPMQIQLTDWSTDKDNTFTKVFKKGDILFGRRRAYLKRPLLHHLMEYVLVILQLFLRLQKKLSQHYYPLSFK